MQKKAGKAEVADPLKAVKDMWTSGMAHRKSFNEATGQADRIIAAISSDPSWKDFRNPENLGVLQAELKECKDSTSTWGTKFLLGNPLLLKKKTGDAELEMELNKLDDIANVYEALDTHCLSMLARHAVVIRPKKKRKVGA